VGPSRELQSQLVRLQIWRHEDQAMLYQLVHDSFTGRFLRYISRGRILPHEDSRSLAQLKQLLLKQQGRKADSTEDGTDPYLVSWNGPDDPEVCPTVCRGRARVD
jgi:hypothetical protein